MSGVERAENEIDSRYGYRLDANSMLAAWKKEEEEGLQVGTYHSHPRGPAEPSQQDINIAEWPDWLYVIVGLSGDPEVRAWWIRDRKVEEEELHVDD